MKKFTALVLSVILCVGLLTACGADYSATESTVFITKSGNIVSTDVEEFNSSDYDEKELETYINDTISKYTEVNGKNSVSLEKLTFADGKATLTMKYETYSDYYRFTGIDFFAGSIAEALAAGYEFDKEFAAIQDGNPVAGDSSEFLGVDGYKVVIIKGNANIHVPGDVLYVSTENTQLVDKNTIKVADGYNILTGMFEAVTEATEAKESATTEVEGTESAEVTEDDMSVSEDEMVEASTEEEVVEFDFGDGSTEASSSSSYTNVYTYVIYK